jgi:hypothetical protein
MRRAISPHVAEDRIDASLHADYTGQCRHHSDGALTIPAQRHFDSCAFGRGQMDVHEVRLETLLR